MSISVGEDGGRKRHLDQVDQELFTIAKEQQVADSQQKNKKRRHNFAPMTQFPDSPAPTPEESVSEEASDDISPNQPPSGFIKRVVLRNFMSHENFKLELGPRLNFIVGNNGSGKSAILTAITVALGAKATDTNRGNSFKDLIREGCYSAKIILSLDNSGEGSYNKEVYGNEIIIERTLRKDAPAGFSLKNADGKEISSKKKDVQAVIDYFAIPVNNPMCFLSQDAARSFLTASTPQDKYHHFMKGTMLQDISMSLLHAQDTHKNAQEYMNLHLENLQRLKQEYDDAKILVQELNQTTDLNQQKRLLQGKSLWIDIDDNNKACEKLKIKLERFRKDFNNIVQKIRAKNEKIDRYSADKEALKGEVEQKIINVSEKDAAHQEARDMLRQVRNRFEKEKNNKAEAEDSYHQCQNNISALDSSIKNLETEIRRQMGGDREQMREELEQLQNKVKVLDQDINALNIDMQDIQNEERRLAQERHSEVRALEGQIQAKKRQVQDMNHSDSTFLNNFGRNMERLIRTMKQRSNEFQTPPIGPLGSYVAVKDGYQKWARSIQRAISSTLSGFVVSNQQDSKLLRRMLEECNVNDNIRIFVYKLKQFDFSKGKATGPYHSIIDVLQFSKPELECLFVDQNKIEKVVLIEDKNVAKDFLKTQPRNVRMALSIRDQHSGYQITGGYRIDTVDYQHNFRLRVGSSSDNGISYLKDLIQQETEELQKLRDRYDERLTKIRSDLRSKDALCKSKRADMRTSNARITQLKINVNKDADTGVLNSKINEKRNQEQALASYEAALQELNREIESLAQEAQPLKAKYDETRINLQNAQKELQDLRDSINNRQSRIEKYKDDIKQYEEQKSSIETDLSTVETNIKVLQEGISKQVETAKEFCSEEQLHSIDLPDNQEDIKRELEQLSRRIQRAESNLGLSQDKVIELFEKAEDKYKKGQEKYLRVSEALHLIHNSIQTRRQNLLYARKNTCGSADLDFRASLRTRNFSGTLTFDIDHQRLDIYMLTPNDDRPRSVDTLSGGEKSFSQMALLLATWEPVRSRILALDEFDVFMDQVNRKIGTTLIVKKLKDLTRTQTLIITPQDIGKVTDINSDGVSIHRIKDPKRHNNSDYYG